MKNIFIGGVAKSGKSRLASLLCKKHRFNHIPLDYFASSFKHNFPELGINSNVVVDEKSSELLALFISRFIEIVESKDDEFFIIDSAHILPKDINKYLSPDKWDIYYLGYAMVTPEEKLSEVNRFVRGGWTSKKSCDELITTFKELINLSGKIKEQCDKNGINYIDTSNNDVIDLFNHNVE